MTAATPALVRSVRDRLGVDQAGLAHLLGVHERTVRRWEGRSSEDIPQAIAGELRTLLVEHVARAARIAADVPAGGIVLVPVPARGDTEGALQRTAAAEAWATRPDLTIAYAN